MAFEFDNLENLVFLKELRKIAKSCENSNDEFLQELSKNFLLIFQDEMKDKWLLDYFERKVITVKNHDGFRIEMAMTGGGFEPFKDEDNKLRLEFINALVLLYLREIEFREESNFNNRDELLTQFYRAVKKSRSGFSERTQYIFDFYDSIPFTVLRNIFHSENAIKFMHVVESTDINRVFKYINSQEQAIDRIEVWSNDYENKLAQVQAIQEKLEKHQTAFNFVGLYDGFSQLETQKKDELKKCEKEYDWLRVGVFSIPIFELIWILLNPNPA